jgi:hypothetical protein
MFEQLSSALATVESVLAELEPELFEGLDAARLVELFAKLERLGAAGKALAARRVAESNVWRVEGDRSAAAWLARKTGTSPGAAAGTLEMAERVEFLPGTNEALRAGRLSDAQARHIADAASSDPTAEQDLLATAEVEDLRGLKNRCERTKAAASDDMARYRQIHRDRSLRTWTDPGGTAHLHAAGTPDAIARITMALEPYEGAVLDAARKAGRREPFEAYRFDALVALAQARATGETTKGGGSRFTGIVLVDHAALQRGKTEPGETCELLGVGPVPVAVATGLLGDAFLAAVVTEGIDIASVVHLGHAPTAHQWSALIARDRGCVVPGCHQTTGLQAHHLPEFVITKHTVLAELALVCGFHHDQATYEGYRLEGGPGAWRWVRPDGSVATTDRSPPEGLELQSPKSSLPPEIFADLDRKLAAMSRSP